MSLVLMRAVDRMKSAYPDLNFHVDRGRIAFEWNDIIIVDPMISSCGRFDDDGSTYGIEPEDAIFIHTFNLLVGGDCDL